MNSEVQEHLELLYGAETARRCGPRVLQLLDRHVQAGDTAPVARRPLTQRDVLLITYGDQVTEPGTAPLKTLGEFLMRHLQPVVSGVHILPFYPWSSDDGFAVKDFFAVDPALGSWADITRMAQSFDLMFDGVFNHLSARADWFQRFLSDDPRYRDFFIVVKDNPDLSRVVRPRTSPLLTEFESATGRRKVWTTFSADQVDLNFNCPEVLMSVLEALLFYASKGARFIRLDAIAYLWKEVGTPCIHLPQTHRVIQLMRTVLNQVRPDVRLITETNVPHQDNLSYFGDGRNEAQLVYNFALPPLVLHTMATGNSTHLTQWAASLARPAHDATFFNFLASHDGIGLNPVRGILSQSELDALVKRTLEHGGLVSYKANADGSRSPYELNISYFDAISKPDEKAEPIETKIDRFLASQAIMLAMAGVPGIYFHSLFGSRNDRAAADTSGIPRRINRQKMTHSGLNRELADSSSLRSQVFRRYCQLLRIRRDHSAFDPSGSQKIPDLDYRVFAVLREAPDGGERVLCLHNVSAQAVRLALWREQGAPTKEWTELLSQERHAANPTGPVTLSLMPYQVAWLCECAG